MIENIVLPKQRNNITTKRDINDQSILEFQLLRSHENWEEIFMDDDDANISFSKFLNIYLRIFHSCFIKKWRNSNTIYKPWLTKGIKTSCNRRRELCLKARDNKEIELKLYYKQCYKISKVIKEVKKSYIIKKLLLSQKIKWKPHGISYTKKKAT